MNAIFQKIPGLKDPGPNDQQTKAQLLKAIGMKLRENGWTPAALQADAEAEVQMEALFLILLSIRSPQLSLSLAPHVLFPRSIFPFIKM